MDERLTLDYSQPFQKDALEFIGARMNCGVMLCTERGGYATSYINERFARYLGYSREEFSAKFPNYMDCVLPEDREYVQTTVAMGLDKQDFFDLIYRVSKKGGGVVWIRENGQRVTDESGEKMLLCVLVDISPDMMARQEIEAQTKVDPLTNVLNRVAFQEQMESLLSATPIAERRHAFIMLDIDHFKNVNDTFGHAFGDRVIEDVAHSLRAVIRNGDLLGRLGGDEFVLCLKDVKIDVDFTRRMEYISGFLHKQLPAAVELSCSMGVAFYAQNGDDVPTLYRHADIALYHAKRCGRNRVAFYDDGMDTHDFEPSITPIDEKT